MFSGLRKSIRSTLLNLGFLKPFLLFTLIFVTFLILLYPAHSTIVTAHQVFYTKSPGYKSLSKPKRASDGTMFAWTAPKSNLYILNITRVAPLKVTLFLNLEKLANENLSQLDVSELTNSSIDNKLVRAQLFTDVPPLGFRPYAFEVPQDLQADNALGLELNSTPSRIINGNSMVGVQFHSVKAEISGNSYSYLLWPQPYLLAVVLLLIGLILWCNQAKLDFLETTLVLLPFSLVTAALMPFLIKWSWPLLIPSSLLIVMAINSQRKVVFSFKPLKLNLARRSFFFIWPVLITSLALGLFLIATPGFIFDTRLFLNWTTKVHVYGPFDIYHHAPALDYPPLIVYILWVYGWLLTPFNFIDTELVFKIFMLICGVGITAVISFFARQLKNQVVVNQGLIVTALSAGLLFNPAVWGQVDALLGLMIVIAFGLIFRNRPMLAGGWLGLLFLFKPQAWVLLPLLAVLLIKKAGWKTGMRSLILGLLLVIALAIPAFGADINSFIKFWSQPSLAGAAGIGAESGSLDAFNLLWLLGFSDKAANDVVTYIGFGSIAIIYLIVLVRTILSEVSEKETSLAAALLFVAFFLLSIKMRERYLYYALPLLGWASLYNRKIIKPFLVVNIICLVNTLYGYLKNNHNATPTSFYIWPDVIQPAVFSWLTVLVTLYLAWLYLETIIRFKKWNFSLLKSKVKPGKTSLTTFESKIPG